MPCVRLRTVRGLLDVSQKRHLMEKITDLLVEVEGDGMRGATLP
jgi:4-oxalocrotonate tautomerase